MKKKFYTRSVAHAIPLPTFGGRGVSVFLGGCAFLLLAISVVRPTAFSGVRMKATDFTAPALSFVAAPFQNAAVFIRDISGLTSLQAENERLRDENLKLREWYQRAMVLETENKSLKQVLNYGDEPNRRYITGRVFTDSVGHYAQTLLVNAGKKQGVKVDQAVITAGGLIGRVIENGSKTSRVLLLKDMNSRVPVLIENSGQHAILAGDNTDSPVLTYLPSNHGVKNGTRIVTSGYGGVFPPGLPIGRVYTEEGSDTPRVLLSADFSRLVYVRMIDMQYR